MTPEQRAELQNSYVNQLIWENRDLESITQLAFDLLHHYLDKEMDSDEKLIAAVKELYPELLNDT